MNKVVTMVILTILLPVVITALLHLPKSERFFQRVSPFLRSCLYGVIYGLLTCLVILFSTMPQLGNSGNVSFVVDAPAIIAGLLFDFPAGIVAAVIGGACRFASVLWAGDSMLRIAGVFGILLSGVLSSLIRKIFFSESYKPTFIHAFFFAILIEIFSFTLIFLCNLGNLYAVFWLVQSILLPALFCLSLCVGLSVLFVGIIKKEPVRMKPTLLVRSFEKYMLCSIIFAVILSTFFFVFISGRISVENYGMQLSSNIEDIQEETENVLDQNLLELTELIEKDYPLYADDLNGLAEKYDVSEINIIRDDINVASNYPENVGFDMRSSDQSKDFMEKIARDGSYVQAYLPMGQFPDVYKKYAGVKLDERMVLQVGYSADRFQKSIQEHVSLSAKYRHIGFDGEILVYDAEGAIVASRTGKDNQPGYLYEALRDNTIPVSEIQQNYFDGVNYTWMYTSSNGFYFVAMIPTAEVLFSQDLTSTLMLYIGILLFSFIFALIYFLLKKLILRELEQVNAGLREVTQGNLETGIDVRTTKEFIDLSDGINQMIASMKGLIHEAETRYENDLNYARTIQYSALPDRDRFCRLRQDIRLSASMVPAEDVGGDFYDFYALDDNHLVFCIADVAGKGIPAAMFMMRVKTLLRSSMEKYNDLERAFEQTNRQICESNEAGLFVTVWMGVYDMRKGELRFVNAGHNPPLYCRYGETYAYLKTRPNLFIGGKPSIKYTVHSVEFKPGDRIFLYTDGVIEANDITMKFYGADRLMEVLNQNMQDAPNRRPSIEENCEAVRASLDGFIGEAERFDDITMLGISCVYLQDGDNACFTGAMGNTKYVQNYLDECNENHRVPKRTAKHIQICADEIVSNIIKYGEAKSVYTRYWIDNNAVILEIEDNGVLYNPLLSEAPDVTLPARKRAIGGLGLFMVKKIASSVEYSDKDGANLLRLVFDFDREN